mgnify:CR=1 FL=1
MKKEYIIPIFVPHLGCKKCCTFCNQKTISGEQKQVTAQDVVETIEYFLENFKNKNEYVEVAFFGGSFTAIEKEKQEELLKAVQPSAKGEQHLCMIAEAGSYAEAVAAVGIDKERGRHVVAV